MSASLTYPASTLAKLFNLTERRIQQLAKQGIIPKAERGKYDLVTCVRAYVQYLQNRALGRGDGEYAETTDIKEERKRLIIAQTQRIEQENARLRGELVSYDKMKDMLSELAVLFSSGVDALPGRVCNECAGLSPAAIRALLFDECRRIRQSTSDALVRFAKTLEAVESDSANHSCPEGKNAG